MVFGISKTRLLKMLLNPYLLYREIKRKKMLKKYSDISLALGENVSIINSKIGNHVYLGNNVSLNNSEIGNHSYANSKTHINYTKVGNFCSIGSNVIFGLGIHPTDLISTHPAFYSNNKKFKTFTDINYFKEESEITIGNDVWIGTNAIIMGGVTIEDGAIVAAGSIVTKDIKPYEVVGGVPAKHIKFRIDEDKIDLILKTKWWNKEEEWFEKNKMLFLNNENFLLYFKDNN